MEKTNIEYFNITLKSFVNDIIISFPEYKETLEEYYSDLLNLETCGDDKYVKRFVRKIKDYKNLISSKDNKLFEDDIMILKNVNFKIIMNSEDLGQKNKKKIWEYIQTLYILSESIISDSEKVKNLVENFQNLRNSSESIPEDTDKELLNTLKNLSNNAPKIDEDLINNGMIGKLAQELSQEINLDMNIDENENVDDLFSNMMNGNNPMKFMNLLQTVGQKIQNKVSTGELDQSKLVEEAQTMMGSLAGDNPLFSNLMKQQKPESNTSYDNPTRDRLKKKLEKRNKKN